MATEININDLNDWLEEQPENTVDTPYEITLLQAMDSSNYSTVRTALLSNPLKYVDLRTTQISTSGNSMLGWFSNCTSLVEAPSVIPNNITNMYGTFHGCTNLKNAPFFPRGILTTIENCYKDCTSLYAKPVFSTSNITYTDVFDGVPTTRWKAFGFDLGTKYNIMLYLNISGEFEIDIYNSANLTFVETIVGVSPNYLSTCLAGKSVNTIDNPYKIYINAYYISDIEKSDIRAGLLNNSDKYIDLDYLIIFY